MTSMNLVLDCPLCITFHAQLDVQPVSVKTYLFAMFIFFLDFSYHSCLLDYGVMK